VRRSLPGPAAALILAALGVAGTALADSPTDKKPKASSFAPHHTSSHVYGTPVSKPILHKRKKRPPHAAPASAEPIK
jgi:hypothetical protein